MKQEQIASPTDEPVEAEDFLAQRVEDELSQADYQPIADEDETDKKPSTSSSSFDFMPVLTPIIATGLGVALGQGFRTYRSEPLSTETLAYVGVASFVVWASTIAMDWIIRQRDPHSSCIPEYQAYVTSLSLSSTVGFASTALMILYCPFGSQCNESMVALLSAGIGLGVAAGTALTVRAIKSIDFLKFSLTPLVMASLAYPLGKNLINRESAVDDAINILFILLGGLFAGACGYKSVNTLYKFGVCHIPQPPEQKNYDCQNLLLKIALTVSSFSAFTTSGLLTNYSPFWLSWGRAPEMIPPVVMGLAAASISALVIYAAASLCTDRPIIYGHAQKQTLIGRQKDHSSSLNNSQPDIRVIHSGEFQSPEFN